MSQPVSSSNAATPSPAYANYVLAVLFVVYVFNFIDRQILGILLDDIKHDLQVSDTAMGFLVGFAFVIFYTLAGIPIARLADHTSRRSIIAGGLLIWSVMTAASGMAQNFFQLALARIGVGVGEAAGSPPSHSLITDYFPLARRGTAFAIFSTAIYIGTMLAFLGGSHIKEALGWRAAFFVVGLPGILLALVVRFTIREPARTGSINVTAVDSTNDAADSVTLGETIRHLLACRSFMYIVAASSVQSISGYSMLVWGPAFLGRVHGMSGTDIGLWLGVIIGITGCAGGYLGGKLADRFGQRDARWYMRLPALQALLCVPFAAGFTLAPDGRLALLYFAPFYLFGAMYVGPMFAMTQSLVKARMRATSSAILLFIVNMIGLGLAPLLVGILNDQVFFAHGPAAIRYSLLVLGLIGGTSSLLFWLAGSRLREDLARA